LEARQGSGTFVANTLPSHLPNSGKSEQVSDQLVLSAPRLSRVGELSRLMSADIGQFEYRPFLPNRSAIDQFPFAVWRKCWNSATRGDVTRKFGYGDISGQAVLRQRIAEYLALHRQDPCDPDQIIITPGGHSAFALAAMLLADPGDGVWFEDPGPVTAYNLFRTLALQMCLVNVDDDGMDVADAIARFPSARLAFTMPSRHHPMGVTLSLSRRLLMLEWARQNDSWIVEDDYDSEFRYVGAPLPSMRSIDRHSRVVYVGSFSKALHPGIRVGYIVLPPQLIGPFRHLSGLINRSVSVETQLALAEFIGGGHFANHLRKMRNLYAERRLAFIEAGQTELDGLARVHSSESGLNAMVWLEGTQRDGSLHQAVFDAGLQCYPLSDYTIDLRLPDALILGFASVPAERMKPYLSKLAAVISVQRRLT